MATIREIRKALFNIEEQDGFNVETIFVDGDSLRIEIKGAYITIPLETTKKTVTRKKIIAFEDFVKTDDATDFVCGQPGDIRRILCKDESERSVARGRYYAAAKRQGVAVTTKSEDDLLVVKLM